MKIINWLYKVYLYSKTNSYILNDSYIFLEYVLNRNRIWIELNINFKLSNNNIEYLNLFLIRRLKGEPLCYILRECLFLNIKFKIYNDIFIPRFSTEIMVDFIINFIKYKNLIKILDLGSGSGVISLSIAKNCINTLVWALDIDYLCVNLIKYNIKKLNLLNVKCLKSNWFNNLKKYNFFDLIISNPPYIWNKDSCLNKKDLRYESYISLVSNNKGFKDINYIIECSYYYLNNNGWLILEHSILNIDKIIFLFNKYFYNVYTYKSFYLNFRFTIGQKIVF